MNNIELSIERIRHHAPSEGYWVGFSGGKDSVVALELMKMAGVKFDAHFNLTTIDPPEVVRFTKDYHPEVELVIPKIPFIKMIVTRGFPMRQSRWCCEEYKEIGGVGRMVVTGIRWEESRKRSKRQMVEACYKTGMHKTYLHPIIHWTNVDVWNFIRERKLPYCSLYDKGWKRIGCICCPCAYYKKRLYELNCYPGYKKVFIKAFNELYADRKTRGKKSVDRWASGEEMFWWWVTNKMPEKAQQTMFE